MSISPLAAATNADSVALSSAECTVNDLLGSGLQLRLAAQGNSGACISWVSETEQLDPSAFIVPDSLVLTRGRSQHDPSAESAFVARISAAGATCLGWGLENDDDSVPVATLRAAAKCGLSVIAIPSGVSFDEISDFVAERIGHSQQSVFNARPAALQSQLLEAALSGGGLQATVAALSRGLGQPLKLLDLGGHVLAQFPPAKALSILPGTPRPEAPTGEGALKAPVTVNSAVRGYLVIPKPPESHAMLRFAVGLLGMELGRQTAELSGRRELLGQVVEDIVDGVLSDDESRRRLTRHGIDPTEPYAVVVASTAPSRKDSCREAAPFILDGAEELGPSAYINGDLCLLVPLGRDPSEAAARLLGRLRPAHSHVGIGIGGQVSGIDGLRTSYLEACEGASRGPGINPRRALTIHGLLRSQTTACLDEIAQEILKPLHESDARSQGDLVKTLQVLVSADFSTARAAETLYVHRNTVKYRVAQIERLTGLSLASTADRSQLWLTMMAVTPTA